MCATSADTTADMCQTKMNFETKMTKKESVKEILEVIKHCGDYTNRDCSDCDYRLYGHCNNQKQCEAEALYNAGYRKAEEVRKETAKEIFQKVVNICRKEEDFQDETVNTQLEPLYFGIMNLCAFIRNEVKEIAKQYSVEVEE